MKHSVAWATAALIALAPLAGAKAVEIVNEDNTDYALTVDDGDAVTNVLVQAGGSLQLQCKKCLVGRDGEAAVEAVDDEVVVIREGKLSVGG
ncbi:MAG: hypothetical protein H6907_04225 [Hyphomicrobiales bacterium]|nr:hypothetical protein [Hyphomicrobiales bacterium]